MKKFIIILLLIMIFGFAVYSRIESKKDGEEDQREGIETIQKQKGFPVKVDTVKTGEFEVWREINGQVEGYQEAFLSTPDTARVAAIHYKIGDRVEADTPIISLDEDDPKSISKVKLLRSVYEDALKEYQSYEKLYKSGGISKDVMDKIELKLETAATNLNAARSIVHLSSPIKGILMSLNVRIGERAEPDQTLAMVSSLEQVRVVAAVSDRDVAEIEVGQPAKVTSSGGKTYLGRIDRVSLGANPDTGLFDLEMVIPNPDQEIKVGSYMTARVRVFLSQYSTYVDSRCVLRDFEGRDFVYQVESGLARKVIVEVTAENDQDSLVKGLNPALPVVLSGQGLLSDKVKLLVLNEKQEL
jgi:RND family efflux transporter MFP subunit